MLLRKCCLRALGGKTKCYVCSFPCHACEITVLRSCLKKKIEYPKFCPPPTKKRGALSCSLTGNVDQSNSRPKDGLVRCFVQNSDSVPRKTESLGVKDDLIRKCFSLDIQCIPMRSLCEVLPFKNVLWGSTRL